MKENAFLCQAAKCTTVWIVEGTLYNEIKKMKRLIKKFLNENNTHTSTAPSQGQRRNFYTLTVIIHKMWETSGIKHCVFNWKSTDISVSRRSQARNKHESS
jgi:hypothetical protein